MKYDTKRKANLALELHGGWIFVFGENDFEHAEYKGDAIDMIVSLSGDTVDQDQAKEIFSQLDAQKISIIHRSDIEIEKRKRERRNV